MTSDAENPRSKFRAAVFACLPGTFTALFFSLITSLAMLVPPLYMLQLFDRVLTSRSLATLIGLSFFALIGVLIYMCFQYLRARIYQVMSAWLGRKLSQDIMDAVLSQSLRRAGAPSQTLRDVGDIKQFVASGAMTAGLEMVWAPIFMIVLFLIHPAYGMVGLIGALILMILAVANELLTRNANLEAADKASQTYTQIGEALNNAETIIAMGILPRVLMKWKKANDKSVELSNKVSVRSDAVNSITQGVRLAIQMSMFTVGAFLVIRGEASMGTLIAASLLSARALSPIEALINGWRQWLTAWSAFKRIVKVAEDFKSAERSSIELPRPKGEIEYERLVFVPPEYNKAVIKGINLHVQPGEMIALVGPSAAGKSTLARLTVGIWPPTSGAIRLDGHDVYRWDRKSFGDYVGYLPQSVELFSGTVRENISRLKDAPIGDVITAAKKAGVHEIIGKLNHGYDTEIGSGGFVMTGGQRQRLALARALFGNPAVLVLDEPDASLDSDGQAALAASLIEEREAGKTVIVVTHRPNLLRIVDRIVVMNDGQIVKITTPDAVAPEEYEDARPADTNRALATLRKTGTP
jgi:ATP-binding cassette subfamily C protein